MNLVSGPVRPFRATPVLPGDKSITHRAYLLGAMARGETRVSGANEGEDCRATLRSVAELGAVVSREGGSIGLTGTGGRFRPPTAPLDLGNSATGLRLLLGVLAGQPFLSTLTGDDSLRRRPMERVLEPLRRMGARAEAPGDHPPVHLTGGALQGIRYTLPVPSAQVKSALLLAGMQAEGRTVVEGGGRSRDHTERLLPFFGGTLESSVGDTVGLVGPQTLEGADVHVPGDPSAAAFYLAALVVVPGSNLSLRGVSLNPTRVRVFDAFRTLGLRVDIKAEPHPGPEPRGDVHVQGTRFRGLKVDPDQVPDLIDELPALAVASAFAEGTTRIRGAGELRVKESDRLEAVTEGLRAIGARVEPQEDGWTIEGSGGRPLAGGAVESRGDHRIAMAFLVAGLGCRDGVRIVDDPPLDSSDPHFILNLNRILEQTS